MDNAVFKQRFEALADRPEIKKDACHDLQSYLQQTSDEHYRLHPRRLSGRIGRELKETVHMLLTGVQVALFDLHWDIRCPMCNHLTVDYTHLQEAQANEFCPVCEIDYDVDFAAHVEVTFTPNQAIRPAPEEETRERPEDVAPLTGLELLHFPLFRDLYSEEVLSRREQLKIAAVTTMFTDITGSTAMYERLGDAVAYNIVRDHFEIMFASINAHGGTVIKTIGDAVMASFVRSEQAIRAIMDALAQFDNYNVDRDVNQQVRIRVGLHNGPSILVTLNGRLDYFGSTINKAARIEGHAGSNEIVMSAPVYTDPHVQQVLQETSLPEPRVEQVKMKGISDTQTVYVLDVKKRDEGVWQQLVRSFTSRG